MSKSVRVTDKAYQQLTELRDGGFESLTNALSVAVDRLHKEEAMMSKKHVLNVPRNPGDEYIATCSCGAKWQCFYNESGLEWRPLNRQAKKCPYNR